ncbi:HET-domain-containing protein, partial [Lentithecium fluviatile CBS 122367]
LPQARSASDVPDNPTDRLKFCGRSVSSQVDFDLLNERLTMCITAHCQPADFHGEPGVNRGKELCCAESRSFIPQSRLIDTSKRCVVLANPEDNYAALSYVWGTTRRLLLLEHSLTWLSAPGALADGNDEVPNTFKDAFVTAQRLGFRYLWIDALCVLKDNQKQLLQHMNAMDSIYIATTLTIISDSRNVYTGVYGVSLARESAQATLQHGGRSHISSKQSFDSAMRKSYWQRRAWCLQEKVFSKKLLIFI